MSNTPVISRFYCFHGRDPHGKKFATHFGGCDPLWKKPSRSKSFHPFHFPLLLFDRSYNEKKRSFLLRSDLSLLSSRCLSFFPLSFPITHGRFWWRRQGKSFKENGQTDSFPLAKKRRGGRGSLTSFPLYTCWMGEEKQRERKKDTHSCFLSMVIGRMEFYTVEFATQRALTYLTYYYAEACAAHCRGQIAVPGQE